MEGDSGNGGGSGGGSVAGGTESSSNNGTSDKASQKRSSKLPDNAQQAFERLLTTHHGDVYAVAEHLFDDNFKTRSSKRLAEEQVLKLEALVPSDGAVVLTGEDAIVWKEVRALVQTPTEIRERIAERDTLKSEVADSRRAIELRRIAEVAGVKYSVLSNQDVGGKLDYDIQQVDDGKGVKVERVFVKVTDDKKVTSTVPFDEYMQTNRADYIPALYSATNTNSQLNRQAQQRHVSRQPGQGTGGAGGVSLAKKHIQNKYASDKSST